MKELTIIAASNNQKKLAEMKDILSRLGVNVISQAQAGITVSPEETGSTFEENARIKAETVMKLSAMPAVADDSGLEVKALDGEPGIYSARYGGDKCKSDADRTALLLSNMQDKEQREAKFVSCIACVFPNGDVITARGEICGQISYSPRGSGGFGYDPVFFIPEYGKTMAELDPELINHISHSASSLTAFRNNLAIYLNSK
jgi:XTP/dITP diphosphohydrolase